VCRFVVLYSHFNIKQSSTLDLDFKKTITQYIRTAVFAIILQGEE
jgi:hypothetical protein